MAKKHKVGFCPHYIDKETSKHRDKHFIDIQSDWRVVVDEIVSCESIISSSLHGLVIAEAYGIPSRWEVCSNKVIGGEFKFRDYLSGTGRHPQGPGDFPPIENLDKIQNRLINALKSII
jgi:pyruvyltransferase